MAKTSFALSLNQARPLVRPRVLNHGLNPKLRAVENIYSGAFPAYHTAVMQFVFKKTAVEGAVLLQLSRCIEHALIFKGTLLR